MVKQIAVIRGDGIGPEIVEQALRVLDRVAKLYGHTFNYVDVDMGGCAIDRWGDPLPDEMLKRCVESDSVLLGRGGRRQVERCARPYAPGKGPAPTARGHGRIFE